MSIRAINWAFGAIASTDLKPSAALTLLALAHCHNQETGRCDPSLATISKKTSLDERSVRRGLRELEELKLIATIHRTIRTGLGKRNLRNRYTLKSGDRMSCGMGTECPGKGKYRQPSAFHDLAMSIEDPETEDMIHISDAQTGGWEQQ